MSMTEDLSVFLDTDDFADLLRWTKSDNSTLNIEGIIDLNVEFFGSDDDIPVRIKTVTVQSAVVATHTHGDRLQLLDAAGTPTGTEYKLQRTLSDDGGLKTIEITT